MDGIEATVDEGSMRIVVLVPGHCVCRQCPALLVQLVSGDACVLGTRAQQFVRLLPPLSLHHKRSARIHCVLVFLFALLSSNLIPSLLVQIVHRAL